MASSINFTELDFFRNKELLKSYLRNQDKFKDFDFEGSNFNVLLDILSYNTTLNNYYVHAAFSEMFLDSAQLRENMNSHAKELNYLPQSRTSSTATIDVILNVPTSTTPPTFITIPRNTQFIGKCNGKVFTFYSEESVTVYPTNGVYRYYGLKIYEGTIVTETYTINNSIPTRYIVNSDVCDIDSIRVFVRDNIKASSPTIEYTYRTDIFGVNGSDAVFYLYPHLQFKYEVDFGKNVVGKEPIHGNVITIEYRTTSGEEANGVKVFTPSSTISGYSASAITMSMSEAGKERETIEDIRYYAPKYVQVQQRAVTESDYAILLKNQFSEIQSIAVYGGEKDDPPQYGRVVIAVDIENSDGVTTAAKTKFLSFLKDRVPLAIEPVIVPAKFMYVEVYSGVVYNTAFTSKSSSDIEASVHTAVLAYSNRDLNKFGETVRFSKLVNEIDAADDYIVSNDTKLRAIIEHVPTMLSAETFSLNFGNALNYDHAIYSSDIHYPAIISSPFTYNNIDCYITDDGTGNVHVVTNTSTGVVIIKEKIGFVDYSTGLLNIVRFQPSAYDGLAIKFYASLRTKDIFAPENRVVYIRPQDITISVSGTRL